MNKVLRAWPNFSVLYSATVANEIQWSATVATGTQRSATMATEGK